MSDWVQLCKFVEESTSQLELDAAICRTNRSQLIEPGYEDLMAALGDSLTNGDAAWRVEHGDETLVVSEAASSGWRILGVLQDGNDRVVMQKNHIYFAGSDVTNRVRAVAALLPLKEVGAIPDRWLSWFGT